MKNNANDFDFPILKESKISFLQNVESEFTFLLLRESDFTFTSAKTTIDACLLMRRPAQPIGKAGL